MSANALKIELAKMLNDGDLNNFQLLVRRALEANREAAQGDIARLLPEVSPTFRLRILEALLSDGHPDLIQLFIETITREKNPLYARQMLFVLSAFSHPQTILALHAAAADMTSEVRSAYDKVLQKLRGTFVEHSNILEFQDAGDDLLRLKEVSQRMLENPHPAYVPVLNDLVHHTNKTLAGEAIHLLGPLGQKTSFKPLFEALGIFHRERLGLRKLLEVEHFKNTQDKFASREILAHLASYLNWDEEKRKAMASVIFTAEWTNILKAIYTEFEICVPSLGSVLEPFYQKIFSDNLEVSLPSERKALLAEIENYHLDLLEHMETCVIALGKVSSRIKETRLLKMFENLFPEGDPDREKMMIAAYAGLGDTSSEKILWNLFHEAKGDPEAMIPVLDALLAYPVRRIHPDLIPLAESPENGMLRRRALRIIAKSHKGEEELVRLLNIPTKVIQADVVRIISENRIQGCYDALLDLLQKEQSDSLLAIIIRSLSSFPSEYTGISLQLFMCRPQTTKIRLAALRTVFKAGGPNRLEIIAEALESSRNEPNEDLYIAALDLLSQLTNEELENLMMGRAEFWSSLLNHSSKKVRTKLVNLIYPFKWTHYGDAMAQWKDTLKEAPFNPDIRRNDAEHEDILIIQKRVKERFAKEHRKVLGVERFFSTLDTLENGQAKKQAELLKNYKAWYNPKILKGHPDRLHRLLKALIHILDSSSNEEDLITPCVKVAGEVGHPNLRARLECFLRSPDSDLRKLVQLNLEKPVNRDLLPSKVSRVLILDETKRVQDAAVPILKDAGYDVAVRHWSKDIQNTLSEAPYDLLMIDPHLTSSKGSQLLLNLRRKGIAPCLTLVFSDVNEAGDLDDLFSVGVDGIVLTPIKTSRMLGKIERLESQHV